MKWISVNDNLPRADEKVLFVCVFANENGSEPSICFGNKGSDDPDSRLWYDDTACDYDGQPVDVYGVTHWMPLPELPNDG